MFQKGRKPVHRELAARPVRTLMLRLTNDEWTFGFFGTVLAKETH